ncbi:MULTISPECIES: methyl-accepting chemotaxis protein [Paenibacillus]|uniref:HAMP domain-containing protein n=1 Tax=Paenibacillus campinasensis TaxID=66347 RepID=A0A268F5B8_9BACL|nr:MULTISPECIES: methyl-accepting chemotaxis protein [Paenibacillus]MUG64441.1 HAMP domain-containing protein [Paenibacillus campinasensis]PAD80565.1 methyl-accepting chemotaxis protein [Paenibacillus campinasensis]PAK55163.1 methyl-accepting chemotaxis protein [Paenibacillus sp. 7541]
MSDVEQQEKKPKQDKLKDKKNREKKDKKPKEGKGLFSSWSSKGIHNVKSVASSAVTAFGKTSFNPAKSVGIRLFLVFFTAIVAFVVILGWLSYNQARNTIVKNAANANQQMIIQTSEKIDIILDKYENMGRQIFYDNDLQKLLYSFKHDNLSDYDKFTVERSIRDRLSNQITSDSVIRAMYLIPTDQEIMISAGQVSADAKSVYEEPWFIELKEGTQKLTWVPTKANSGAPYFTVARALGSMNDLNSTYVVMIDLDVSVLNEQLAGINLGDQGQLQLVSPEGTVVSSSVIGLNGTETNLSFLQELPEDSRTDNLTTRDEEHRSVLAVYNKLATNDWKLVGVVQERELTKDATSILFITWIVAAVDVVVAILIGIWMVRMIARPLGKLNLLMKEGAKGNLNVRTDHKGQDEIGQLSASFNDMMEQITKLVQQTNNTAQDVLSTAAELSDASKKTAISAKEIAVATEEIANGASSLAVEAERGSDLTNHISQQMKVVVNANEEMGKSARHVESSSELGTKHLNDLLDKTHQTEDMTRSMMRKVDELKETTSSVVKVLDVMQNITKQTNILSLNATIEAARAGAAGRGFMVVADEIRQLAEQSRQSIDMVSQITDRIMTEMNETVQVLLDANPLFKAQMDAVKETSDIFLSVRQQMGEFIERLDSATSSIGELNDSQNVLSEAMSNVSAVAEESSATSEEVASLSNEQQNISNQLVNLSSKLENVSKELKETLSRFTV